VDLIILLLGSQRYITNIFLEEYNLETKDKIKEAYLGGM